MSLAYHLYCRPWQWPNVLYPLPGPDSFCILAHALFDVLSSGRYRVVLWRPTRRYLYLPVLVQ